MVNKVIHCIFICFYSLNKRRIFNNNKNKNAYSKENIALLSHKELHFL